MINAAISIRPRPSQKIQMSSGAILKAMPNALTSYAIINLYNVSNVEISGGTLLGERYEHIGNIGEGGHGILINDIADTITIRNLTSKDCWGDGVFIGSSVPARNILLENVICDNNRRQGMSITHAENVIINNSTFKNTNGTNPQAGIDIEPNPNCYVKNVAINNSSFFDNEWAGIALIGSYGLYVENVKISDCTFDGNYVDLYTEGNVIDSGYIEE